MNIVQLYAIHGISKSALLSDAKYRKAAIYWTTQSFNQKVSDRFRDIFLCGPDSSRYFTSRCHAQRDYATMCRLIVCDVQVSWPQRLEYFENKSTADELKVNAHSDLHTSDMVQRDQNTPIIRAE